MSTSRHRVHRAVRTLPLALVALAVGVASGAPTNRALASSTRAPGAAPAGLQDSDEAPPAGATFAAKAGGSVKGKQVYFAPQDSDASGTVLILFSSRPKPATVEITGYSPDGVELLVSDIDVPAFGSVRVVSDVVANNPPPSFANTFLVNFTDAVSHARVTLPKGIHIDGYVILNPGTGTIDPRADQGAIPLRFSDRF